MGLDILLIFDYIGTKEIEMDVVKRLSETYEWIRNGNCCGEVCTDGICMAPACSFGEALESIELAMKQLKEVK